MQRAPLIIFVSGIADRASRIRGLELGAVDYVVKPYDVEELLARIRVAMRTKAHIDSLAADACTDALTGLANRAGLRDRLVTAIGAAERYGRGLSCLMLDIDHFKRVNDVHGHDAGDDVLAETARRLQRTCRRADTLVRYGGEEFLVMAPDTAASDAVGLADRIRRGIADRRFTVRSFDGRVSLAITVSVGVAHWTSGIAPEDLLTAADRALLNAKRKGRNRLAVCRRG